MRLNTKTRYATRALLELALQGDQEPLSLGQIAERQDISAKYLESIFGTLRTAGLVRSVHGPQGGYRLARPPETIALRELFMAFEGREGFVPCTREPALCDRAADCVLQGVWAEFYAHSLRFLEGITLADLMRRARALDKTSALNYVI